MEDTVSLPCFSGVQGLEGREGMVSTQTSKVLCFKTATAEHELYLRSGLKCLGSSCDISCHSVFKKPSTVDSASTHGDWYLPEEIEVQI